MNKCVLIAVIGGVLIGPMKLEAQSARRAFWYSLLIPGWGHYHADDKSSGARFLLVELGLWGGYFSFRHLGAIRRNHYRTFATEHARAHPEGKNKRYFDDLGFYDSRLWHNRFAHREDGLEAEFYPDTPDYFWEWDRAESRRRYRELRNASENAKRQALFTTGLVIANHLFAAIHAARGLNLEKQADTQPRVKVELNTVDASLGVVLRKQF
jgi:hypothetical protein